MIYKVDQPTLFDINNIIAEFFYNSEITGTCDFDRDMNLLIEVVDKIMNTNGGHWYCVHRIKEYIVNEQHTKNIGCPARLYVGYKCAFCRETYGKLGYGEKFDHNFFKQTVQLAIHYSVYRWIKNGVEY